MKKIPLFPIDNIQLNPNYIFPYEKRKWTIEFRKWCEKKYDDEGNYTGIFCCGNMKICSFCTQTKLDGCKDCVEAIKNWFKFNNKPIPYKNINYEKILEGIEKG